MAKEKIILLCKYKLLNLNRIKGTFVEKSLLYQFLINQNSSIPFHIMILELHHKNIK